MTAPIYQTVNPTSGASLLTQSASESAGSTANYGFTSNQGTPFRAASASASGLLPVFRLYNAKTAGYLWTIWSNEVASAAKYGYTKSSTDFYASDHRLNACQVAVERLQNPKGTQFRNAVKGSTQFAALIAAGWLDGETAFYAAPSSAASTVFTASTKYLTAQFDGSGSASTGSSITSYVWNFGDGTSGTGGTTSHVYARAGSYPATLAVTDADGSTGTVTHPITVAAQVAPVASFTSVVSHLTASFDGSASSGSTGTLTAYAWRFGDGTTATGATASHTYPAAGSYSATLTVTDNAGAQTAITHPVTVSVTAPVVPAGSLAVGLASYPLPANAVYVATNGSNSGSGSIASPLATVKAALAKVSTGGTIVVRGGDYNQNTLITASNVTIENYPGEAVWFDGSIPVTGWTQSGSTWVHSGWTYQFDSSASFTSGSNAGGFVNPAYPMAAHPDQVFLDGAQMRQIASNPGAGQFAVDYTAHTITIGSDPNGHAMRASNIGQAFVIGGGYDTIRGIGVENYATSLPQGGSIYLGGSVGHLTLNNVDVENSATVGVSTNQTGVVINHVTSDNNGMAGMEVGTLTYGQDGAGEIVTNSKMNGNNTENFNCAPAAAGIKIGRINGISVTNNQIVGNHGVSGIWTDQSVSNFIITGNTVTGNGLTGGTYGIEAELSDTGVVANNTVSGSQYGITMFDTGHVSIYNNSVSGNGIWGIGLVQDERRQATSGLARQPSVPWIVQNDTVNDNILGPSNGYYQLYAFDKATNRPPSSMVSAFDGNLFSADKSTGGDSTMVGWGGTDNHTVTAVTSPAALRAIAGTGWNNAQEAKTGVGVAQMSTDAASLTIAVPLPMLVAQAVGEPTGTTHIGTF